MTKVNINSFDQDSVAYIGNAMTYVVATTDRFNGVFQNGSSPGDTQEYVWQRYFPKSGTYRVKLQYMTAADQAILDIGLDSVGATNLFNQLDQYAASPVRNVESFTTVEIARGQHDIHITVNGKNASSSNFVLRVRLMEFELIDEHQVVSAEGVRKASGVSWEEIGRKKIHQVETSIDVKIPEKRFLRAEIYVIPTSALLPQMRLNNDSSGTDTTSGNYSQRLNKNGGADDTTGEQDRTQINMLNSSSSATPCFITIEIVNILDEEKLLITHAIRQKTAGAGTSSEREESVSKWDVTTALINEINIIVNTSSWAAGSEVVIYGHD